MKTIDSKLPTELEKTAGAALARIQLDAGSLPLFFLVFTFPNELKAEEHLITFQCAAKMTKDSLFFRGHGTRIIGVYPTSHDTNEHLRMAQAIVKRHQQYAQAQAAIERSGSMKKVQ